MLWCTAREYRSFRDTLVDLVSCDMTREAYLRTINLPGGR
jgi:hypothetical protein